MYRYYATYPEKVPPPYAPPPPPFAASMTSINRLIGSLKMKAGFEKKVTTPVDV